MGVKRAICFFFILASFLVLIVLLPTFIYKKSVQNENKIIAAEQEAQKKDDFLLKVQEPSEAKILIITFNLNDTGAPLMFLYLTQMLHQRGYNVFLLTYAGGRHEEDLKKENIPYLISKDFFYNAEEAENLFSSFDVVISGRIPQIYTPSQEHKFIWWDHGLLDCVPMFFFQGREIGKNNPMRDIKFLIFEAKDVVFVSELQQQKLAKCRKFSSEVIHNGINPTGIDMDDPVTKKIIEAKKAGKTVFVTVGYIAPIKGQDILVNAIELLPDEYRRKTSFFIVGSEQDKDYFIRLREKSKNMPEIIWTGPVLHEKIGGIYESADVLLSPSRSDTAPLVVQEAAEHYTPSVITENMGSTYIIQDGKSGFIIPIEDPQSLMEKIKFFVDNPDKIKDFGKVGRQNYEKYSSFDTFIKKWEDKIKRKLKEVKGRK